MIDLTITPELVKQVRRAINNVFVADSLQALAGKAGKFLAGLVDRMIGKISRLLLKFSSAIVAEIIELVRQAMAVPVVVADRGHQEEMLIAAINQRIQQVEAPALERLLRDIEIGRVTQAQAAYRIRRYPNGILKYVKLLVARLEGTGHLYGVGGYAIRKLSPIAEHCPLCRVGPSRSEPDPTSHRGLSL